jgi:hypothetical protein
MFSILADHGSANLRAAILRNTQGASQREAETSYPKIVLSTSYCVCSYNSLRLVLRNLKPETCVLLENSQEELWLALLVVHAHLF